MNRRKFFKNVAAASAFSGLNITAFNGIAGTPADRLWIFAHSGGGWDTTLLCDPKGDIDESGKGPVNKYPTSFIRNAGNIQYVPTARPPENEADPDDRWAFADINEFFTRHYQQLLVINGIKVGTIAHGVGAQLASSGHIRPNQPHFAALYAAIIAETHGEVPLPFGYHGGYSESGDVVPRVPINAFEEAPSIANAAGYLDFDNNKNNDRQVFNLSIDEKIRALQAQRLERQLLASTHPRAQQLLKKLRTARTQSLDLSLLKANLPDDLAAKYSQQSRIQHVLAAMKAGLTYGAHFAFDGVDSHYDSDARQYSAVNNYFGSINYLLEQAENLGLRDRLNIVMASDFSRTPYYNSDRDGKDHWSVSSMMFMGPDFVGNRVVGATTGDLRARKVNYETLALDDANGREIEIRDIHKALREQAGLDNHPLAKAWPLERRDMENGPAIAPKGIFTG